MTLMEKNSNVNRIFESNKFTQNSQSALGGRINSVKIQNSSKNNEESRRSSGNSITIRITNDKNVTMGDESLENILNENYSILNEAERNEDIEVERENTSSQSNSLEREFERSSSKKKSLKDRKKLVRSSVQQKHQLTCQESEDQPEITENTKQAFQSQNTAFDELFAAAHTGNFIQSAHVEAKMAIAASAKSENNDPEKLNTGFGNTNGRGGSFRHRHSFKKVTPTDKNNSDKTLNPVLNNLKVDDKLGTPQQLTRSQSCKRPGSFKRLRSKNDEQNQKFEKNNEITTTIKITPANVSGRRGTHGSIALQEDLEKRCGSLPFENLDVEEDTDVCRVRQFNITNKGVINRGDSFKRSFRRSNNSISSKKDISPTIQTTNQDSNTLNLPDTYDGFIVNKSRNNSSYGLNNAESSSNADTATSKSADNNSISLNNKDINLIGKSLGPKNRKPPIIPRNYLVYMLGASSVGKNALIKQFQTSEYRGTYDVDEFPNQPNMEDKNEGVTIALDGVESILQFVSMDIDVLKLSTKSLFEITRDNDAFIVVYSISDKASFNIAIDLLKSIRMSENSKQPVILVGNKSDLARKRAISREDAGLLAFKFGCKFVETSVAINDKVDDLLAGMLKQIRLHTNSDVPTSKELRKSSYNFNKKKMSVSINKNTNNTNNNSDIKTTSFIENTNKHNLHKDCSDADAMENMENRPFNNRNLAHYMSLKTRRLFRANRNKDNSLSTPSNPNYSDIETRKKLAKISFSEQQSFFHKVFNNIFRRRSNLDHLNSVENLFTRPSMI